MAFSIIATIRAFVAPNHRLSCEPTRWRGLVSELEQRGHRRHESGAFLLGTTNGGRKQVTDAVFYDELDPHAYDTGVCVLGGESFAKLWAHCRERKLTVVADVHTHPDIARQSYSDKTNPMVARDGHTAIILPNFARWPIKPGELGVYEYRGDHNWADHSGMRAHRYFYTGFWG